MAPSTIRQVHWILSAALAAAVRWDWITSNPATVAKKPRPPAPQPEPPTAAEAAGIIEAAWEQDDDWGTLVWLVMVTGMRSAPSCSRCAGPTSTSRTACSPCAATTCGPAIV